MGVGGLILAGGGVATFVSSLPQTPGAAPLPSHVFGPGFIGSTGASGKPVAAVPVEALPSPPPPESGVARVVVPSLGINAPWVNERISGGALGIPTNVHELGIWDAGDRLPAPEGNVVVAGHVNYLNQGPGALSALSQVRPGAVVYVTDSSGSGRSWKVTSLQVFAKSALPAATFKTSGPRHLLLITCGGPFDSRDGSYLDNVVVTAVPT